MGQLAQLRKQKLAASNGLFGVPGLDRSGRLDMTEPPDLGALLTKINQPQKG